jgi:hypothetical protein
LSFVVPFCFSFGGMDDWHHPRWWRLHIVRNYLGLLRWFQIILLPVSGNDLSDPVMHEVPRDYSSRHGMQSSWHQNWWFSFVHLSPRNFIHLTTYSPWEWSFQFSGLGLS